jgi:hypothetical protein
MTADNYHAWLAGAWSRERLATVVETRGRRRGELLYTDMHVGALSDAYSRLGRWTPAVGESLEAVLTTVLRPYHPERPPRVGIFFRDWPIPCEDSEGFAPEERGAAPVPPDIMAGSIDRAYGDRGPSYVTLRRGFNAGYAVARHLGFDDGDDVERFVRTCVVGDLVKIQALFRDINGSPFVDALSKRSCHSWGMYAFAGEAFAEEVDLLDLSLVIGFGSRQTWARALEALRRKGWNVEVPTPGSGPVPTIDSSPGIGDRRFILLPHPQAWGWALERAVAVVTGKMVRLPEPPRPSDVDPDEPRVRQKEGAPMDLFYARIEEWLQNHFGDWDIEPRDLPTMRSFRPEGRLSGAIYGRTPRGRKLVFHCHNRDNWLGKIGGFRVAPDKGRRVAVYIEDDRDLSALDALIQDWE